MAAKSFASPNITLEEWQSGGKTDVDIFEDQLRGWVFVQVAALRSRANPHSQHAGQAVLALVTPYFEMVTAYLEGRASRRGETADFLKRGLASVFGDRVTEDAVEAFVTEVRNGLFHELIFRTVRFGWLIRQSSISTAISRGFVLQRRRPTWNCWTPSRRSWLGALSPWSVADSPVGTRVRASETSLDDLCGLRETYFEAAIVAGIVATPPPAPAGDTATHIPQSGAPTRTAIPFRSVAIPTTAPCPRPSPSPKRAARG